MSAHIVSGDWQFLRRFMANPLAVASPVPSGHHLAEAIAAQIDTEEEGAVLELGPGTGAVTQAILDRGVAPKDIIAIESDSDFVSLLRRRFLETAILEGDAFSFRRVLANAGLYQHLRAIVCGVPVLSQPEDVREHFLRWAMAMLKPGMPFIQFTYDMFPPITPPKGISVEHAAGVWLNLPPMHVWVYRTQSST